MARGAQLHVHDTEQLTEKPALLRRDELEREAPICGHVLQDPA